MLSDRCASDTDRSEARLSDDQLADLHECIIGVDTVATCERNDCQNDAAVIASAAQQMAEALSSTDNGGGPTPEVIEEKNAHIADLEAENDELRATVDDLRQEVEGLRSELDQRPEIGERAVEAVEVLSGEFGVADGDNDALQRKLKRARKRIEELEEEQDAPTPDVLDHPQVERYISRMQSELRGLDDKERQMLQWFKYNGPGSAGDAYWAAGGARDSRSQRGENPARD